MVRLDIVCARTHGNHRPEEKGSVTMEGQREAFGAKVVASQTLRFEQEDSEALCPGLWPSTSAARGHSDHWKHLQVLGEAEMSPWHGLESFYHLGPLLLHAPFSHCPLKVRLVSRF